PLMRGSDAQKVPWRDAVFSDSHYGVRHARRTLGIGAERARAFMVRTTDWKYVEYPGFAPQLFDLRNDPSECVDLGCDPHVEPVRREMKDRLYEWFLARSMRTNLSAVDIEERTGSAHARGYLFGLW
nr:phosphonate monoester hydrolase [Gammaproteobacteria bacterium]